jgi:hypothetical protein
VFVQASGTAKDVSGSALSIWKSQIALRIFGRHGVLGRSFSPATGLDETGLGFPRVVLGFRRVSATTRCPACSALWLTHAPHQRLQKSSSVFVHCFDPGWPPHSLDVCGLTLARSVPNPMDKGSWRTRRAISAPLTAENADAASFAATAVGWEPI